MPCDPETPNQYPIVLLNRTHKTQLFMEFYCFLYLLTAGLVNICLCKFKTFSFKETLFAQEDTIPSLLSWPFHNCCCPMPNTGHETIVHSHHTGPVKVKKNQNINYFISTFSISMFTCLCQLAFY